jgi:hypothetical protein
MKNCTTHHACACIEADRKRLQAERDEAIRLLKATMWRDCKCNDCKEARAFLARMEVKP